VSTLEENLRPRLLCRAVKENAEEVLGPPDIVHDVGDLLSHKLAVIRAHHTQVFQMFPQFEEQADDPNSDLCRWFSRESFWEYRLK
jgi:LmbE family N-acetylglucosaminyl deacetylase